MDHLESVLGAMATGRYGDARALLDGGELGRAVGAAIDELERRETVYRRFEQMIRSEIGNMLAVAQAGLEGMVDGVVPPNVENLHKTLEAVQAIGALLTEADEWL